MYSQLVITPAPGGWCVQDPDARIPPSVYRSIEDARREACEYLARRGGGELRVSDGSVTVLVETVAGIQSEAAVMATRNGPPRA